MADVTTVTLPPLGSLDAYNDLSDYGAINSVTPKYRLTIQQIDGNNFFGAPIAPREVTYSNWGRKWSEVPRDGRRPYLVPESEGLPKMSMSLVLANSKDALWDATEQLKVLKWLSDTTIPLKIAYGGYFESHYQWRMTNLSWDSVYRHPTTNAITQATVDLEFTIVNDVVLITGPISGGV